LPNEYLPTLIKANGEATVRGILESHFISLAALNILLRDPFGPDDFEAFIAERQRTIQDAIETYSSRSGLISRRNYAIWMPRSSNPNSVSGKLLTRLLTAACPCFHLTCSKRLTTGQYRY